MCLTTSLPPDLRNANRWVVNTSRTTTKPSRRNNYVVFSTSLGSTISISGMPLLAARCSFSATTSGLFCRCRPSQGCRRQGQQFDDRFRVSVQSLGLRRLRDCSIEVIFLVMQKCLPGSPDQPLSVWRSCRNASLSR